MTFEEVAFEVCSAFDRHKVLAVLVGGGAATYYAPKAYQTKDLDFVLHLELFGAPNKSILDEIGFKPTRTRGTYASDEVPFTLEILRGPLGVGDEDLSSWETIHKGDLVLHVISVLDSIKDRMAHAIHNSNGDPNASRQAAEVAKLYPVDLAALHVWCVNEGGERGAETFRRFEYFVREDASA